MKKWEVIEKTLNSVEQKVEIEAKYCKEAGSFVVFYKNALVETDIIHLINKDQVLSVSLIDEKKEKKEKDKK